MMVLMCEESHFGHVDNGYKGLMPVVTGRGLALTRYARCPDYIQLWPFATITCLGLLLLTPLHQWAASRHSSPPAVAHHTAQLPA
jgi:hypothetical protein